MALSNNMSADNGNVYTAAINANESHGQGDISTITNPSSGAYGSMQITSKGAGSKNPGFGVRPSNGTPQDNARVGRDYFNALNQHYGDPNLAAIAYDWGPGNTDMWLKNPNGPDFSQLPKETLKYVDSFDNHVQAMNAVLGGGGSSQQDQTQAPAPQAPQLTPQPQFGAQTITPLASSGPGFTATPAEQQEPGTLQSMVAGAKEAALTTGYGVKKIAGQVGNFFDPGNPDAQRTMDEANQGIQQAWQESEAAGGHTTTGKIANFAASAAPYAALDVVAPEIGIPLQMGVGAAQASAAGESPWLGAMLGGGIPLVGKAVGPAVRGLFGGGAEAAGGVAERIEPTLGGGGGPAGAAGTGPGGIPPTGGAGGGPAGATGPAGWPKGTGTWAAGGGGGPAGPGGLGGAGPGIPPGGGAGAAAGAAAQAGRAGGIVGVARGIGAKLGLGNGQDIADKGIYDTLVKNGEDIPNVVSQIRAGADSPIPGGAGRSAAEAAPGVPALAALTDAVGDTVAGRGVIQAGDLANTDARVAHLESAVDPNIDTEAQNFRNTQAGLKQQSLNELSPLDQATSDAMQNNPVFTKAINAAKAQGAKDFPGANPFDATENAVHADAAARLQNLAGTPADQSAARVARAEQAERDYGQMTGYIPANAEGMADLAARPEFRKAFKQATAREASRSGLAAEKPFIKGQPAPMPTGPVIPHPDLSFTGGSAEAVAGHAGEAVTLKDGNQAFLHTLEDPTGQQRVVAVDGNGKLLGDLDYIPNSNQHPSVEVTEGARRNGVASAMYDKAVNNGMKLLPAEGAVRTPEGAAFRKAYEAAVAARPLTPQWVPKQVSIRTLQSAKAIMEDATGKAYQRGASNLGNSIKEGKNALDDVLKTHSDAYSQANKNFAAASGPIDRMAALQPRLVGAIDSDGKVVPGRLKAAADSIEKEQMKPGIRPADRVSAQDLQTLRDIARQVEGAKTNVAGLSPQGQHLMLDQLQQAAIKAGSDPKSAEFKAWQQMEQYMTANSPSMAQHVRNANTIGQDIIQRQSEQAVLGKALDTIKGKLDDGIPLTARNASSALDGLPKANTPVGNVASQFLDDLRNRAAVDSAGVKAAVPTFAGLLGHVAGHNVVENQIMREVLHGNLGKAAATFVAKHVVGKGQAEVDAGLINRLMHGNAHDVANMLERMHAART